MNQPSPRTFHKPLRAAALLAALCSAVALASSGDWVYRGNLDGDLDDGYYQSHTLTLYGGFTYYFEGSCDGDCSDVDLKLKNDAGRTVVQDMNDDDVPEISFYVPSTRRYTLEVHMADCSWDPCSYDVDYYRRAEW